MSDLEHLQRNLSAMKVQLDNIEKMVRLDLAANPNNAAHVRKLLEPHRNAVRVYLELAKGPQTQADLVKSLGLAQSKVSDATNFLLEYGLIERGDNPKGGRAAAYFYNDLERIIGISRIAKSIIGK